MPLETTMISPIWGGKLSGVSATVTGTRLTKFDDPFEELAARLARDVRGLAVRHSRSRGQRVSGYVRTGNMTRNIYGKVSGHPRNGSIEFEVGIDETEVPYAEFVIGGTGIYGPRNKYITSPHMVFRRGSKHATRKAMVFEVATTIYQRKTAKRTTGTGLVYALSIRGQRMNDFLFNAVNDERLPGMINVRASQVFQKYGIT